MTGWRERTVFRDGVRLVVRDYGELRPVPDTGEQEQVAGRPAAPEGVGDATLEAEQVTGRRGEAGSADPGSDPSPRRAIPALGPRGVRAPAPSSAPQSQDAGRSAVDASPATVLLLHGLAGHSGEWDATARLLGGRHRVVALDQRGQGASERHPDDMSRAAHVGDVVAVIEELGLGDVVLVGQSLGGHTAMLTAAAHPQLISALVLVEAGPGSADPDPRETARVREWLASWPVPFPSPAVAADFFGGGPAGAGWAAGLEERADGWWPRFEPALMGDSLTELSQRSFQREWEQVACPTLVVLAESGMIPSEEADAMTRTRPGTAMVHVPGVGHDLHLEAPGMLHTALTDFLEAL
jgi:pimeloyl-ACP methyl ester carboxylesterase